MVTSIMKHGFFSAVHLDTLNTFAKHLRHVLDPAVDTYEREEKTAGFIFFKAAHL